jgi:hypothetical protein
LVVAFATPDSFELPVEGCEMKNARWLAGVLKLVFLTADTSMAGSNN